MEVRLQKFLADAGVASRRKAEEMILARRVMVNDIEVCTLGTKIDVEKDQVKVDGNLVHREIAYTYILLNKPSGYISAVSDPRNRLTVIDLLNLPQRLYPVGRLDYNTSGLLLLTDDGELTYKLTHPKHEVNKTYIVKIRNIPSNERLNELRRGTDIGPYTTSSAEIKCLSQEPNKDTARYQVVIHEGKNRQVRNMFEYLGCEIMHLSRTGIGSIRGDGLTIGEYRHLTKAEVDYLKGL